MEYVILIQLAVYYIFHAYLLILLARALLSWVRIFNPYWRPEQPLVLFLLKLIYLLTEPPLLFMGKIIKPLQIGNVGVDLSFIVLFLLVMVLQRIAIQLLDILLI